MSARISLAGLALIALSAVARAQNQNPGSAASIVITADPTVACSQSALAPTPPTIELLVSDCGRSQEGPDGFMLGARAISRAGHQGFAAAATWLYGLPPNPLIVSSAIAGYTQYVTITGSPITDIYRIMLRSSVDEFLLSDVPGVSMAAVANFDVGVVRGPGAPTADPSDGAMVNAPDGGGFIDRFIDGASLGSSSTIFFQLIAQATLGMLDMQQSMQSSVLTIVRTPTITLLDSDLNDITNRYSLVYDPDDVPPVTATPEPASLALMVTGFAGVAAVAHRRRKSRRKTAA